LNSSKSSGLDGFGSPGVDFDIDSFQRIGGNNEINRGNKSAIQNMNVVHARNANS